MNPVQILEKLPHHVRDSDYYLSDPNYYPVYAQIAAKLEPVNILEVGTLAGYSLVAFLCGSPETVRSIYGVDNESYWMGSRAVCEVNVMRACAMLGRPPVHLRNADGFEKVDIALPFDLIHLDADHSTVYTAGALRQALEMQATAILVDDLTDARVYAAVEQVAAERNLMWVEVATLRGLAIFDFSEPDADHLYVKYSDLDVAVQVHVHESLAASISTDFPQAETEHE